jgi:hypothetical protein
MWAVMGMVFVVWINVLIVAICPFPFKGKVGMGMGFCRIACERNLTETHPHPSPPLEGEGIVSNLRRALHAHCELRFFAVSAVFAVLKKRL